MKLESKRICGECTACCEGWLTSNIYGHMMRPGTKCHFLGAECTIYQNRPENPCKQFKCVWLEDKEYAIPEWIKPSLSKIIIVKRPWGEKNQNYFWQVVECGQKMDSEVLHWLISFCEFNNICIQYSFNQNIYRRGSVEFNEFFSKKENL